MDKNDDERARFQRLVVPHFEAGYNLARWLAGNDADAADIVQNSALKAFRFIGSLRAESGKGWFLQIVRNTAYSFLKQRPTFEEFDEIPDPQVDSETLVDNQMTAERLRTALQDLDPRFREILVLRELEELNYEEIAQLLEVPLGTVMSRLSRARLALKQKLIAEGGRS